MHATCDAISGCNDVGDVGGALSIALHFEELYFLVNHLLQLLDRRLFFHYVNFKFNFLFCWFLIFSFPAVFEKRVIQAFVDRGTEIGIELKDFSEEVD